MARPPPHAPAPPEATLAWALLRGRLAWPPRAESMNKDVAGVLAALLAPIAAIVYFVNLRRASHGELQWQREELTRMSARLQAMITHSEGFLHLLKTVDAGAVEACAGAVGDKTALQDGRFGAFVRKCFPAGKDDEFKVRFLDMWKVCCRVMALHRREPNLGRGLDVAGQILSMELSRAVLKTLEGNVQEYRTGERLKERLQWVSHFRESLRLMRGYVTPEYREILRRHERQLLKKYLAAYLVLGRNSQWDMCLAFLLVLKAKWELCVLTLASTLSAVNGAMEALDVLYYSEALELLRIPGWTWRSAHVKMRAVLAVRILRAALRMLTQRVRSVGQSSMEHRLRTAVYESLLHQDFDWYRLGQADQRDVHSLFRNVFDLPRRVNGFTQGFTSLIETGTSIAGQTVIVRQKSSPMLYTMLALEWGTHGAGWLLHQFEAWLRRRFERDAVEVELQWIEPLVPDNLPTVRSCTAEQKTLRNWDMFWQHNMRKEHRKDIVGICMWPLQELISQVTSFGAYFRAAGLIRTGQIHIRDFEPVKQMSTNIANSARQLWSAWFQAQDQFGPLARTWDIVSLQPNIGLEGGLQPLGRPRGALAFESVTFRYDEGAVVLDGMSFEVPASSTCAITGASGAGKSTVFRLIQRFYDVRGGRITLDSRDIRELNPTWLRRQLSFVEQTPRMFSLTLRENLAYGCVEDPTVEQITAACRAAGMYELIFQNVEKFPAGLDTRISQHTLSGGELQRLAIARALLKDAPVLLLDEATSSLDSRTQSVVKEALANLMKGRTVLTIAHRLETIQMADQILCVGCGKVLEKGSHTELVAQGGIYAELYDSQVTALCVSGAEPGNGAATDGTG